MRGELSRRERNLVAEIILEEGLAEHAHMFWGAHAKPKASAVRAAIRLMVDEYLRRQLPANGVPVQWSPPPALRGYDKLVAAILADGSEYLHAVHVANATSLIAVRINRTAAGAIHLDRFVIEEETRVGDEPLHIDRVDPVAFIWSVDRPAGRDPVEMVIWSFDRGRGYEVSARRPLGSASWEAWITCVYNVGERLHESEHSPMHATSDVDMTRGPRVRRISATEVELRERAAVTLHCSDERFPRLAAAFEHMAQLLPEGSLQNPGRPNGRLRR
jgi:hypothetical protein